MSRFYLLVMMMGVLMGCSTDALQEDVNVLENSIASKEVVIDNVIACAASNPNDDTISVFFYPRAGATNIQYFETENTKVDKSDLDNYTAVLKPVQNVFNGYLQKFEVTALEEKWAIVAFDEDGKTHLSNPIRLKQFTKPTEYLPQNITVAAATSTPIFTWEDGSYDDTKIYFQVLSDSRNNLISGTYTFEKTFQFYNLENVVLNITTNPPGQLRSGNSYGITLMGVSEDNWVNMIAVRDFSVN
ncbi:MAG: hypothetical protein Mars2KO_31150 [Maribacter sp.]